MKIKTQSRLPIVLCAALVLSWLSLGGHELQLSGVVAMGAEKIASLEAKDGLRKWCAVGDQIGGYRVTQIRAEEVVLVDGAGKSVVVTLRAAVIGKMEAPASPKQLIPPEKLNWKWIKSDQNPMRQQPETIPEWAYANWEALDEDIKIDLKNYYRAHGWDIQPRTVSPGRVHVRNIRIQDPSEPEPSPEERRKTAKPAALSPVGETPIKPTK
jgi:hypothetical protein